MGEPKQSVQACMYRVAELAAGPVHCVKILPDSKTEITSSQPTLT